MANMIPFTTEQILDLFKSAYYAETGQVMQIGSDEFAFSSVAAYVLRVFEQNLQKSADQTDITTATGKALDNIGLTFGLTRPQAQHAKLFITIRLYGGITDRHVGVGEIVATSGNAVFKNTYPIQTYNTTSRVFAFLEAENAGSEYNGLTDFTFEYPTDVGIEAIASSSGMSRGGTDSIDEYTQKNDDLFREYILQNIDALSVGTARYYEEQAKKGWEGIVVDAKCLVDGEEGFEAGMVDIFLAFNENISIFDQAYMDRVCGEIKDYLSRKDIKCVTDSVRVFTCLNYGFTPNKASIVYDEKFKAISENGKTIAQNHFESCVDKYKNILRTHIGKQYSEGELCDILTTPNEEGVYANSFSSTPQIYSASRVYSIINFYSYWDYADVTWNSGKGWQE